MPTTFALADREVLDMLADVLCRWHRPLADAGVRFDVLTASNEDGAAVVHNGYPAIAKVRIVPLRERVKGAGDAEIMFDQRWWEDSREEHRVAMLDHEAQHVMLAKLMGYNASLGKIEFARDDIDRPKLRIRKGDWNAGDGFRDVCERHGDFALEFDNLSRCWARAKAAAEEGGRIGAGARE